VKHAPVRLISPGLTQKLGYSGLGVAAQRSAVAGYLGQTGGQLLSKHIEVESRSSRKRPLLTEALAQCRRNGAILVIAKLDRLARNVAFASFLMESGVEFLAVDAPYANRLMIHILAAFAERERKLISQRTKAALTAAKERGVRLGSNGARLAMARKSEAIAAAGNWRLPIELARSNGAKTLQQIARYLNDRGHLTRSGAQWGPGTVHRAMHRLDLNPVR
jgi:DNA invertase Pin-like site-specific DNA recombinase